MKLLTIIAFVLSCFCWAQTGFKLKESKHKKVSIPFQVVNNLIILPIKVNGTPLQFLLDTGVNETIMFSTTDQKVEFKNIEKLKFKGLGENKDVEALRSIKNTLLFGDQYIDDNHSVYIILDEDFNMSSSLGFPINGILGYSFFKNHPIEIDYIKSKITIYSSSEALKNYTKRHEIFPITIELNKPYMETDVEMTSEKKSSKMLLDTGNTDSIWLFPTLIPGFNYNRPNIDDFLGSGFSGDIYGKRSRIHGVYFGSFKFIKPLVAMPDAASIAHLKLVPNRKGSLGSEIFRRFNVIFDYNDQHVYFKKNKHYNDPFIFDMSGIEVKQKGMVWTKDLVQVETSNTLEDNGRTTISPRVSSTKAFQYKFILKPNFVIAGTRKDSPAQNAGLAKDDVIVKINNSKASDLTLSKITNILREAEGQTVHMEIDRNGYPLKVQFTLIDPIPYQDN